MLKCFFFFWLGDESGYMTGFCVRYRCTVSVLETVDTGSKGVCIYIYTRVMEFYVNNNPCASAVFPYSPRHTASQQERFS